jgi:hypothetical protein
MSARGRNYRVSLTLPNGKVFHAFIQNSPSKVAARGAFFFSHLAMARKAGLRGPIKKLMKELELPFEEYRLSDPFGPKVR